MYVLLTVILIIIVTLLLLYLKDEQRYDKCLSAYPYPKGLPFLGQALEVYNSQALLNSFYKYFQKHGTMFRVKIAKRQFLVCADVKFNEFFLPSMKHIEKSDDYKTLKDWFADGLLTATGNKWRIFRKILTPTFHFEILEPYVDVFNKSVDVLIRKLENEVDKDYTNIYPYLTLCTLDSICETAMGTCINAQEDPDSIYVQSIKEMDRIVIDRAFSSWKQFDSLFRLSSDYRISRNCIKVLHDYSDSIIKSRRAALLTKEDEKVETTTTGDEEVFGRKKKMAFLDLLLKSTIDGQPLSDIEIRNEVDTFMFAGHDTTASAISFTIFCLANNQDVQKRAVEELELIYGDDKHRPVNFKDIQNMSYLELVIKESLRIYPAVPIFGRELQEDVEYAGGILPKGLTITMFVYGIHMNPDIYPEPEKFDPERFLPENQRERNYYSYIPFSAGPRNCIGQRFAMLEIKAMVSKLLRFYEFLPIVPKHKLKLAAETIMKSHNDIPIKVRRRKF